MFGINITAVDWASWIIAILVTIYVARAKNEFEKGTDEYQALRLCRIGLALLVWSFGLGLIGFAFALTSFILAIIGIVKGRTMYGIMIIIGSVCLPIISVILSFLFFTGIGSGFLVGKSNVSISRQKAAKLQFSLLGTSLDTYRLDTTRFPTTKEGLIALRIQPPGVEDWDGPYLTKDTPLDPWGNHYIYQLVERGKYRIGSLGADGKEGGTKEDRDIFIEQ